MITTDSKVEVLLGRLEEEKYQSDDPKHIQKVIDCILRLLVKDQAAYKLRRTSWLNDAIDWEEVLEDGLDQLDKTSTS
tara:strand:- start:747 stop:980 length:234 start_codon:yes stop_codon:yes gene_type:complete